MIRAGLFCCSKQQFRTLTSCADASVAEDVMMHRRPESPGSFQDDLGNVIERIARAEAESKPKARKPVGQPVSNGAELNDRLFEYAWRKSR